MTNDETNETNDEGALAPKQTGPALERRKAMAAPESAHRFGREKYRRCNTDTRGYPTPENRDPRELVLEASEGFIPLWSENVTLRWRFHEASLEAFFANVPRAKRALRDVFAEAVLGWGDAAPVKFKETGDGWDFQIRMQLHDDCDGGGCVLAEAFFPDAGRHNLILYPTLLDQPHEELVETLQHELGHVFGLRHFFAQVRERSWRSEIFGTHDPFTIMNYGEASVLTETDKRDLKTLYSRVWSGELKSINGTRIVQVRPYHELR
jgi:hypothetical protein